MSDIMAVMDQDDSYCGMYKTGFTGCAAPRAVSVSLVVRDARHHGQYGPG